MDQSVACAMSLAWESGDNLSGMELADYLEDHDMAQCGTATVGSMVFILTATHYFLGKLEESNFEEYVLAENAGIIYRTGDVEQMMKSGRVDEMDKLPVVTRVRRGGIIAVMDWPHKTLPTVNGRN